MAGAIGRMLTPRREISPGLGYTAGGAVAGLIILLWCVLTYGGLADTTFFPPPHQVAVAFWTSGAPVAERRPAGTVIVKSVAIGRRSTSWAAATMRPSTTSAAALS